MFISLFELRLRQGPTVKCDFIKWPLFFLKMKKKKIIKKGERPEISILLREQHFHFIDINLTNYE